jgi:hypothetical protein
MKASAPAAAWRQVARYVVVTIRGRGKVATLGYDRS